MWRVCKQGQIIIVCDTAASDAKITSRTYNALSSFLIARKTCYGLAVSEFNDTSARHALMHSTSVLGFLDERTACIYIFSSDICAFSSGAGVALERPPAIR